MALPPTDGLDLGSDGLDGMDPPSTPIRGATKEERRQERLDKTIRRNVRLGEQKAADRTQKENAAAAAREAIARQTEAAIDNVFACMKENGISFGKFLVEVFDPSSKYRHERYATFANSPQRVIAVLNAWSSPDSGQKMNEMITEWSTAFIADILQREGAEMTSSGFLRTQDQTMDEKHLLQFSLPGLYTSLTQDFPVMVKLVQEFATTPLQKKQIGEEVYKRKENVSNNQLNEHGNLLTIAPVCNWLAGHSSQFSKSAQQPTTPSHSTIFVYIRCAATSHQCTFSPWHKLQLLGTHRVWRSRQGC